MLLSFSRAPRFNGVPPVIAGLAFVFAAAVAHADAVLVNASPCPNATVALPSEIQLEFNEGVEPHFSGVTLTAARCGVRSLEQRPSRPAIRTC